MNTRNSFWAIIAILAGLFLGLAEAEKLKCGCKECTAAVLNTFAGDHKCGDRISFLMDEYNYRESQACLRVAGLEFPNECGKCNPNTCSIKTVADGIDEGFTETTMNARTDLYCFPEFKNRTRFRNVFGPYTVEVKESDHTCGPNDNRFGTKTVSLVEEKGRRGIKLQFKKVGTEWEASEVRVRLPESREVRGDPTPFLYGNFSFSVKSIEIIDSNTDEVVDNVLPQSLVLGLFTWDDTELYAAKENMNHEVDIEISRWNDPHNMDLQFLVQPPGHPQQTRFFSGPSRSFQQAPRKFSFRWSPGEIEWHGDRGEYHSYSAQIALDSGTQDFTQCLPADMEVRLNLWNIFGTARPPGLADHHVVEVVIDDFSYAPSDEVGLPEGAACGKGCQCESSNCIDNRCRGHRDLLSANEDGAEIAISRVKFIPSFKSKSLGSHGVDGDNTALVCSWLAAVVAAALLFVARRFRRSEPDGFTSR